MTVQEAINPQHFPVVLLLTESTICKGPNRSRLVVYNTGEGFILVSGKGAMICFSRILFLSLHLKQLRRIVVRIRFAYGIQYLSLDLLRSAKTPLCSKFVSPS